MNCQIHVTRKLVNNYLSILFQQYNPTTQEGEVEDWDNIMAEH